MLAVHLQLVCCACSPSRPDRSCTLSQPAFGSRPPLKVISSLPDCSTHLQMHITVNWRIPPPDQLVFLSARRHLISTVNQCDLLGGRNSPEQPSSATIHTPGSQTCGLQSSLHQRLSLIRPACSWTRASLVLPSGCRLTDTRAPQTPGCWSPMLEGSSTLPICHYTPNQTSPIIVWTMLSSGGV